MKKNRVRETIQKKKPDIPQNKNGSIWFISMQFFLLLIDAWFFFFFFTLVSLSQLLYSWNSAVIGTTNSLPLLCLMLSFSFVSHHNVHLPLFHIFLLMCFVCFLAFLGSLTKDTFLVCVLCVFWWIRMARCYNYTGFRIFTQKSVWTSTQVSVDIYISIF